MSWEFISTGGCARCDAMEGFYDEEPERPHPYCECQIIEHEEGTLTGHVFYYQEESDPVPAEDDDDEVMFYIRFSVFIDCCGTGEIHQTEIEVEARFDDVDSIPPGFDGPFSELPDFAERFQEQLDEAEDDLADECIANCNYV
jgi:hypothetical protein